MIRIRTIIGWLYAALLFLASAIHAKTVVYNLHIKKQDCIKFGKKGKCIVVNGSLSSPTLTAKVGDDFIVHAHNHMDEETSLHWHGVILPQNMDAVPYINTPPIKPGESFTYCFPIKQSGTYWYHAHSGLQEQEGLYGALVFYPSDVTEILPENEQQHVDCDEEAVVVISDWTHEEPKDVLANLKKDPDYYALKKGSVQSWLKVLQAGAKAIEIRLNNLKERMGPMDLADVGYDGFLMNGKASTSLSKLGQAKRIRLRVINASASSYFILTYGGGAMQVIAADGVNVAPFKTNQLQIAIAETYDIVVQVPENKSYEFRATCVDGSGYTSGWVGVGEKASAKEYPKPNLVLMDHMRHGSHASHSGHGGHHGKSEHAQNTEYDAHNNHMTHMMPQNHGHHGHGNHQDHQDTKVIEEVADYRYLKSPVDTRYQSHDLKPIELRLTGNMERYNWRINDVPMYQAEPILIRKGQVLRIKIINETMMHHPIHFHGHFFRVLNQSGDQSPLKHTVNVQPFETLEIELYGSEEKDWIFHCHNLYHMKLGMGGLLRYSDPTNNNHVNHQGHAADHGNIGFVKNDWTASSNLALIKTTFMHQDNQIHLDLRHNYKKDFEHELLFERYYGQFFGLYVGGKFECAHQERKSFAVVGLHYTLPFLIEMDLRLNNKGRARLGFGSNIQATDRMQLKWQWNSDKEYTLTADFTLTKQLSMMAHYDSREKWGLGARFKF